MIVFVLFLKLFSRLALTRGKNNTGIIEISEGFPSLTLEGSYKHDGDADIDKDTDDDDTDEEGNNRECWSERPFWICEC